MVRRRRAQLRGALEAQRAAASLGAELRTSRTGRRLTIEELAEVVGVSRSRLQELEAGRGSTAPLGLWFAIGAALDRPFAAGFSRDLRAGSEPADAGHLAAQELVLRISRGLGRVGRFELSTRPWSRDGASIDVGIRDDVHRALILVEIWNRTDDVGRGTRSTHRKAAEATDLASFRGYRVAWCWLLVDTAANRALVREYPEILRAEFRGSSYLWVHCLVNGTEPPIEPGIAWIDPRSRRIYPLRLAARP